MKKYVLNKYILNEKWGSIIKVLWLVLTLIPVPFLFHFYETLQFAGSEDVPFLLLIALVLLYVLVVGAVSINIKLHHMIVVSIVSIIVSVLLGAAFITPPNPSWFNPFGRDLTIIFTGIALFAGQFIVRSFRRMLGSNSYFTIVLKSLIFILVLFVIVGGIYFIIFAR